MTAAHGKAPPCLKMNLMAGFVNSWDFAMNWTFRRRYTPAKKWSHWLKWFGARITGPVAGMFSTPIALAL